MEIKLLRLASMSLIMHLRNNLFFSAENEVLNTKDNIRYTTRFNPWVISTPFNIYRDGALVAPDEYTLNYLNNTITFNTEQVGIISADYSYNWVKIVDTWPDELYQTPVISLQSGLIREKGLQIGGGTKVYIDCYLNIFARNRAARDDIVEIVKDVLSKDIPLIDFNKGFPVNEDGTKNSNFSIEANRINWLYTDPDWILVRLNPAATKEEEGRALLEITLLTTKE